MEDVVSRLETATIASAVLLACGLACMTGATPARVPAGAWGGPDVRLSVNEQGATIEFACAHGTLDAPLELDAQGRFDVPGRFIREGGPEREGETGQAVRYAGRSDGKELTLEIVFPNERGGPYTMVLGRSTRLVKCK